MALQIIPLAFGATPKIYTVTSLLGTAEKGLTDGAATIYQISCINNDLTQRVFFKFYNHPAPTVGTTDPTLIIPVHSNGAVSITVAYLIVEGMTFDTNISVAVVITGGTGGTTDPGTAGSVVIQTK